MSTRPRERRGEIRRPGLAERISWAREDATTLHTGWVNDTSPAGVAFITPRRFQPAPGDRIELTFGAAGRVHQHAQARVLRTEPYDRYFSIVACQRTELR
jgi:hypothetical protein